MAKRNSTQPATVKDVKEIVIDASETILKGVEKMFEEQDKKNERKFATKDDLKKFATKKDLKRETSWIRDDIKGLKADLSDTPSRKELRQLEKKVDSYQQPS